MQVWALGNRLLEDLQEIFRKLPLLALTPRLAAQLVNLDHVKSMQNVLFRSSIGRQVGDDGILDLKILGSSQLSRTASDERSVTGADFGKGQVCSVAGWVSY